MADTKIDDDTARDERDEEDEEIVARVKALYTKYPYPSRTLRSDLPGFIPEFIRRRLVREKHRSKYARAIKQYLGDKAETGARLLEAGCGTGELMVSFLKAIPNLEIDALDLSEESLEKAKALSDRDGVTERVNFKQANLMEEIPFEGPYDFATSLGVLHCLPEPAVGLRHIQEKLKSGGHVLIYVYGELGRFDIQLKKEALAILEPDLEAFDEKCRLMHELGFIKGARKWKDKIVDWLTPQQSQARDIWHLDALAHPNEKYYRATEILDWTSECGLEFVEFISGMPNELSEVVDSDYVLEKAKDLTQREKFTLIELLTKPHQFTFIAKKP